MQEFIEMGFVEKKYFDFPNIINLEVYRGACPCSCIHCPVGRVDSSKRDERFGVKMVSLEMLKKIIEEMKIYPHSTIRLHSVGEPILWPELIPAIKSISDSGIRSWIFSSLVTNNIEILESLCKYCDIVEVSINSIDADDYIKNKGINAFEIVFRNIKYMSVFIKNNNLRTRLVVSRVQSDYVETDNGFVSYWKQTGLTADAFVRKYHNYNNLLEKKENTVNAKTPCLVHWMRLNIAYDGTVVTCFNELFHQNLREDVVLGNLKNESIYDIWHNEKYNNLRKAELCNYSNDNNFLEDFPCRNCFSCQSYDGKRETSEKQINALK